MCDRTARHQGYDRSAADGGGGTHTPRGTHRATPRRRPSFRKVLGCPNFTCYMEVVVRVLARGPRPARPDSALHLHLLDLIIAGPAPRRGRYVIVTVQKLHDFDVRHGCQGKVRWSWFFVLRFYFLVTADFPRLWIAGFRGGISGRDAIDGQTVTRNGQTVTRT